MTDFLPRTITADAQGVGFVSVRGYGVEIIDGGVYGRENTLHLIRGEDGLSDGLPGADEVPCVAGVRMLGEFTGLRLVTPRVSPVQDQVKVRVLTQRGVHAVDTQPHGKPRIRFLSRGSVSIGPEDLEMLWSSATGGEFDRFSLEEQFDAALRWYGWIASAISFEVIVWASKETNPAGNFFPMFRDLAVNVKVPFPTPHPGGYVWDFQTDVIGTGTQAFLPFPFPPGSVEVWAYNPSTLTTANLEWIFGVTG